MRAIEIGNGTLYWISMLLMAFYFRAKDGDVIGTHTNSRAPPSGSWKKVTALRKARHQERQTTWKYGTKFYETRKYNP